MQCSRFFYGIISNNMTLYIIVNPHAGNHGD